MVGDPGVFSLLANSSGQNTLAGEQNEQFPNEKLKIPAGDVVRERMPQVLNSRDGGDSNLHLPFCLIILW